MISIKRVNEIDEINILQATLLAMKRAVENLKIAPQKVLIDGNQIPKMNYVCEAIIKGDQKIQAISAASILAKVTRDRLLLQFEKDYKAFLIISNMAKVNKFIFWTPRILAILFILFLAMFSLDVFESASGFGEILVGLFIHNIPAMILLVVLRF